MERKRAQKRTREQQDTSARQKKKSKSSASASEEVENDRPSFLFAPGAGAGHYSEWMKNWINRLSELGTVHGFSYPYQLRGKKAPDKHNVLIEHHKKELGECRKREDWNKEKTFLVGKSMGSRMSCHVAVENPEGIKGIICFGYPLKGINGKIRSEVLTQLNIPILFLEGTRDSFAPKDLMEETVNSLSCKSELKWIQDGDHSLMVKKTTLKKDGKTQSDVDEEMLEAVKEFVTTVSN